MLMTNLSIYAATEVMLLFDSSESVVVFNDRVNALDTTRLQIVAPRVTIELRTAISVNLFLRNLHKS